MSNFSALYPVVRVFLGDTNESAPGYTNDQLDMGIKLALLKDEEFSEGTVASGVRTITPDVTDKEDQLRLSIRAAKGLLSPNRGPFSYRTKVFSVSRNLEAHMRFLDEEERKVVDGDTVILTDTEWDQYARGVDATLNKLSTG